MDTTRPKWTSGT